MGMMGSGPVLGIGSGLVKSYTVARGQHRGTIADLLYGEQTSGRVASIASRGLDNPASLTLDEIRSVCASALTQAPNR